jgi:hypothetical protein
MPCVKEFEFFFVTKEYITLKQRGKKKEPRRNLSIIASNDNGKRKNANL